MIKHLAALVLMACGAVAQATEWRDSPAITQLFKKEGVTGTFVVHDVALDTDTGHNRQRAAKRFIPASTFKLANSLIALSTGAVASVDEIVPYDGKPVYRAEWAKDMDLREAIKVSNVPVYQTLARRIGMERMRGALVRMNYGNMDTGKVVDRFWLDGPLEISAIEQTVFLARLAQGQLPFENVHMEAVRAIARQDGPAELYAKTGLGKRPGQPDIGWWVGWVRKDGKLYTFALNIDIPEGAPDQRVALARAALQSLGLL